MTAVAFENMTDGFMECGKQLKRWGEEQGKSRRGLGAGVGGVDGSMCWNLRA